MHKFTVVCAFTNIGGNLVHIFFLYITCILPKLPRNEVIQNLILLNIPRLNYTTQV